MSSNSSEPASEASDSARPPQALALFDFARARGELSGELPLSALPRLRDQLTGDVQKPVQWSLRGFERTRAGLPPQAMVVLRVRADVGLVCQRCLHEMVQTIDDAVQFRLVIGEPPLTQEEIEAEDEALPAQDPLDVLELIEDQLILAMPLVPMHPVCPHTAPGARAAGSDVSATRDGLQRPFAQLRTLLQKGGAR